MSAGDGSFSFFSILEFYDPESVRKENFSSLDMYFNLQWHASIIKKEQRLKVYY